MRLPLLLCLATLATSSFSTEPEIELTKELSIAYRVLEVYPRGRRVAITCHTQVSPPVTYSLWGSRDIEVSKKVVSTQDPVSFHINVTLKSRPDLLTYTCQAGTAWGMRLASAPLQLYWELWAKPVSQLQAGFTLLDREAGPRLELSCQAASGSPPITYSLVGRDGHVHMRQTPQYGQPANFSFPLTQTPAWLQCQAQNGVSVQSSPLTLVPPGQLPKVPTFVLAASLTSITAITSGMLGWTAWTRCGPDGVRSGFLEEAAGEQAPRKAGPKAGPPVSPSSPGDALPLSGRVAGQRCGEETPPSAGAGRCRRRQGPGSLAPAAAAAAAAAARTLPSVPGAALATPRGGASGQAGHRWLLGVRGRRRRRRQRRHGERGLRRGQGGRLLRPAALPGAAAGGGARREPGLGPDRVLLPLRRGLQQRARLAPAALRLQPQRGRLPLRPGHRRAGLPGLRLLPGGRRLLPADQQRRGPQVPGRQRPALLSSLDLPVVRGFLLPHQPVGSHQPERRAGGRGLSPSGHHLQLLLHLLLGPAGRPGLPALQGRGGRLYAELRGPRPGPQHNLRLLPGPACGQLPTASFHSERRDHRGLPASRCVLSHCRGW